MLGRAGAGVLILVLAVTGCKLPLLDPSSETDRRVAFRAPNEVVVNGIRATLSLDPSEVERTESFTARLTLTNTRSRTATWTSGYGCLAFLGVYRGEERIPFEGTNFGCLTVFRAWQIAPGESLVHAYPLQAQRTDGAPVAAGEYRLEADLHTGGGLKLVHRLVVK